MVGGGLGEGEGGSLCARAGGVCVCCARVCGAAVRARAFPQERAPCRKRRVGRPARLTCRSTRCGRKCSEVRGGASGAACVLARGVAVSPTTRQVLPGRGLLCGAGQGRVGGEGSRGVSVLAGTPVCRVQARSPWRCWAQRALSHRSARSAAPRSQADAPPQSSLDVSLHPLWDEVLRSSGWTWRETAPRLHSHAGALSPYGASRSARECVSV